MVLAQGVSRQGEGPVLVGAGVALTESIIDRIRQAGVGTICVEGNPLGAQGTVGNLRVVADNLPFLFRRHKDNVFMMTLCTVFSRHFARRMAEQRAMEDAAIEAARNKTKGENDGASAGGAQ
ncbi:hypothetical protein KL86DPRO_10917 [uncultured delta proteobacterium]|uniref:Uncharacterized protein n=1 Tax=uncultured delta proteobacterium TaxID=34034 RepID=A0A212J8E3_9DELT|nr:hypothetical protein KL86DPRO_10917 [uncultured delta proteobacterium]